MGTNVTARRLGSTTLAALCALVGLLAFVGGSAQALITHYYSPVVSAKINEGIPAEGPHGEKIARPGPLELLGLSMAVDSGHLWAVEGSDRIDEFDAATGAFLAQPITRPEEVFFGVGNGGTAGVAIGHTNGKDDLYVGEGSSSTGSAVGVYSESGTLEGTWTGAATPAGSFSRESIDVAVDNSINPLDERRGDVYVASGPLGATPSVVDVFHPEADGKEHYVGQITGSTPSEPFENVSRVAVDDVNGDVIVVTDRRKTVDIFEPALGKYVLAHKITGPAGASFHEVFNLSVDGVSGDIYIDDLGFEGFGAVVDQFSAAGAYLGRTTGGDTPHGGVEAVFAIAVDPESHNLYVDNDGQHQEMDVFGGDVVFPDVTTGPPSSVTPFSATLNGAVNPQNAGAATCRFEWGTGKLFGRTAPCEPGEVANGGSPVPVHTALSGLQPDTTYFYRLQATNGNGTNPGEASQDQEFTTPGPGIHEASVTNLASTSVTFDASIDPHKVPSSVYFQYGTSAGYGTDVPAPPGEAIGSGEGDVEVPPHHVQGLQAGTVYHYRVVVVTEPKPGEVVVFDGPDQVFTTETAAVSELPDGRHWEMVSPPDKKGAKIQAIPESGVVQAADTGGAFTYLADGPTELEPLGSANLMQVLSRRGPEGWRTRDLGLPHKGFTEFSVGFGQEYRLFSDDLSHAVVKPFGSFVPWLSPEASESTAMLQTLDASCGSSCFRPLVTGKPGYANVPPGTVFGKCGGTTCGPDFAAATPDLSHIVTFAASMGEVEWSNGHLTSVAILPDGTQGYLALVSISRDGSRLVLSGLSSDPVLGPETLYMRDVPLEKTVPLDAAEPACVAESKCAGGGSSFQLASADGSKVFFTNRVGGSGAHRLTKDSGKVGSDLYECEMVEQAGEVKCKLSDIAREAMGVVGASEDGSYVYFVANSSLAEGAVPGECEREGGQPGPDPTCNLYVRHGGITKLVAVLSAGDEHDWDSKGHSAAQVSPDGNWLEFMSQRSVTGDDNRDAVSGKPDAEVYLYDASTGRVACASCDRTGARPTGAEYLSLTSGEGGLAGDSGRTWNTNGWVAANVPGWGKAQVGQYVYQSRYLSDTGRLFFDSGDALVPQDVNGTQDVYEYEPPGAGNCTTASATYSERAGGCVGLISAGTSAEESAFLDASTNGGDVFLLTFSKLQPQDYDNSADVYDAHECTSAVPCFPTPVSQPPACTTAEACRAAPTPQPASFGAPSSATFSGAGNIAPGSGGMVTTKSLTLAQKLANALHACKKKSKRKRVVCERRTRAQYGSKKPKAATKKGKR